MLGQSISLLLKMVVIIILSIIFKYTYDVSKKKCKCALGVWDFNYIKYYTVFLLLFNILYLFFNVKRLVTTFYPLLIIIFGLNILYIYTIFKYLSRTEDCKCSKSWVEKVMKIYGIIQAILISISIIGTIFIFSVLRNVLRK